MPEKKSVLIIDDDKHIHDAAQMILEKADITVVCCDNAAEALNLTKGRCFQVIVTDYRMPGEMSGVELTRLLRHRCPDSFIIGLSGERREKDFLDAGADAFFEKPFPFGDLISLIEQKAAL